MVWMSKEANRTQGKITENINNSETIVVVISREASLVSCTMGYIMAPGHVSIGDGCELWLKKLLLLFCVIGACPIICLMSSNLSSLEVKRNTEKK
jgi:hypothetical protein